MKVILNKLLTLCLFIVSIGCFYVTFTMTFVSSFINFVLFFVAIFFLIQACGMFDKIQGYGQYLDEPVKEPEATVEDEETNVETEQNNDVINENNETPYMEYDDYSDYD